MRSKQKSTALLPPKKVFGKLSESVVRKRLEGLNRYLKTLQSEITGGKQFLAVFLAVPKEVCSLYQNDSIRCDHEPSATRRNIYSDVTISHCSGDELQDAPNLIVDNVSNQMIDVYSEPLQLKGRDAIARQHQYSAAVSLVEWPSKDAAGMEQHLNTILFSMPGKASGEAILVWANRLKKPALFEEEEIEILKMARCMADSTVYLELPKFPSFVVTFSEQRAVSPLVKVASSAGKRD